MSESIRIAVTAALALALGCSTVPDYDDVEELAPEFYSADEYLPWVGREGCVRDMTHFHEYRYVVVACEDGIWRLDSRGGGGWAVQKSTGEAGYVYRDKLTGRVMTSGPVFDDSEYLPKYREMRRLERDRWGGRVAVEPLR